MTPTSAPLLLRTLGLLQLERAEGSDLDRVIQRSGKPLILLAWLARREGSRQEKAAVAHRFWPDADGVAARKSLRQALHVLRGLIGADAFLDERDTLVLRAGAVALDLNGCYQAIGRGDHVEALRLYRGTFLPRSETALGDAMQGWVHAERSRLRQAIRALVQPVVEARIQSADFDGARALAQELVGAEAGVVDSVELLCDALVAAGRLGEAVTAVGQCDPGEDEEDIRRLNVLQQRLSKLRVAASNETLTATGDDALPDPELVGRDAELSSVMQLLEEARGGRRRRCLMVGRAGIGKSRLMDAIGVRARWRGARVVRVEFAPAMRDTPLSAVRELCRVIGSLPGAVGIQPASAARLVALVPALAPRFSGVDSPVLAGRELHDPRDLAALVAELLGAVSEDRLRVLLCDDVHYADPTSQAVFAALPARDDLPLLELWAGRPPLDFPPEVQRIELAPLGVRQVQQLFVRRAQLPDADWVETLIGELHERTGGLPRLIAAQLRALERSRMLEISGGHWVWHGSDPRTSLRTIRTGVVSADAGLSGLARSALRMLATWHRAVPESVLWRALAELHPESSVGEAERAVRELDALGFVQAVADGWSISHDVVAVEALHGETAESFHSIMRALLEALVAAQRLDAMSLDACALLCGSRDHLPAAVTLISRAASVSALRRQGLFGRVLARRIAQAASRPEWEQSLVQSVGWIRRQSPAGLLRLGGIAAAIALVAGWTAMMLQPRLIVESAPMGEMHSTSPDRPSDAVELVVQPRVGVFDGFGRRLTGFDGAVRVRAIHGQLNGDTVRAAAGGRVQFERLTITDVERVADGDWRAAAPQLEFRAGPLVRSARVGVAGAWGEQPSQRIIRLRAVSINGAPLDSSLTYVRPAGADSLRVELTFEYSTSLATANYVVGAAGTWLPPESVIRLAGLPRPVREAWRTVAFALPVPSGSGSHHVIIAAAPEESVQHLFSATNWVVGAPRWRDGNDLVDLPLWALDSLRRNGRFEHDGYLLQYYAGYEADIVVDGGLLRRWRPSAELSRGALFDGAVLRIR